MKNVNFEGKRIKHISHGSDLDGVFSFILTQYVSGYSKPESVEYVGIEPTELYHEAADTVQVLDKYDLVIITDLTITKDVFKLIDKYSDKFIVFDHHRSHLLDDNGNYENDWLRINTHESTQYTDSYLKKIETRRQTCATKLYWTYLKETHPPKRVLDNIDGLVDIVRIYDTYEFKQSVDFHKHERYKLCKNLAPKLNILFHAITRKSFEEYMLAMIKRDTPLSRLVSTNHEFPHIKHIFDNEYARIEADILIKIRNVTIRDFHGIQTGVIFSESNTSEIGNRALEKYPEIDMCMIIHGNRVSLRSRSDSDIDVFKIASIYNGGGHRNAAGYSIDKMSLIELYMDVFSNDENPKGV